MEGRFGERYLVKIWPQQPVTPGREPHQLRFIKLLECKDMEITGKARESIRDAIAILDSAPFYRDLMSDGNIVQVTNRAPIAHLAVERGLKALIINAGRTLERTHDLNRIYRVLGECNKESSGFLAKAFDDAVEFFGYDVRAKGFEHFQSIGDYLSKVGGEKDFNKLRYWVLEGPVPGSIRYISLCIHREILCALYCLFLPNLRETVSERVERVIKAAFNRTDLAYNTKDEYKKDSVDRYKRWLEERGSLYAALEEAAQKNFAVNDDEFISQTLRESITKLRRSKDPAVRYRARTFGYLPKGSQQRNSDADPTVKWLNKGKTNGTVITPAGTQLGKIEKYPDGAWGITPEEEGLVTDVARALADAKHYLVNRLTRRVIVTVNGKPKQLRIISQNGSFPQPTWIPTIERSEGLVRRTPTYEMNFWDAKHGLVSGDAVSVELQPDKEPLYPVVLEGIVSEVAAHEVSIAGNEVMPIETIPEA